MKILFGELFGFNDYDLNRDFLRQLRRTFWIVTRHIMLLLVVLVLYLFVLFKNPQGVDIVSEVILNKRYWVWTLLALLALGISLWFCAAFLLQMKEISPDAAFKEDNQQGIQFWLDYLPGLLGLLPMIALLLKGELYRGESWGFLVILFLLLLILPLIIKSFIRRLEGTLGSVKWFDDISMEGRSLRSLLYFKGTRTIFWTFVGYSFVLFVLSLTSVETGVAILIGPFAVMIFGLSFMCAVLSLVMYYNIPGHRPALLFFGIYIAVISGWNDNSSIRTMPMKTERVPLEEDFQQWAQKLVDNRFASDTVTLGSDTLSVPIVFVATEGGGLRALFWTVLVLQKLEAEFPGLHNNIYGISGVSGGGVGATFYISYLYDQLKQRRQLDPNDPRLTDTVHSDFLSDLLASFLFQDNLQNVLPFAIKSFDRSRQLEDAWSHSFSFHTNSDTFEKGFTELYADTSFRLPRLFINGTLAESGQKTIVSYPLLRRDPVKAKNAPDVLRDEIDVLEQIGGDVPVKTAASLCSRFPYLTSGGLINEPGSQKIGHVIDGGYRENTGLETVWQLLLRLKPVMQREQRKDSTAAKQEKWVQFQPVVLFIRNSPPTAVLDSARHIPGILHELLIPVLGSGNASDRRTPSIDALTENVFKNYIDKEKKLRTCAYEVIDLDRSRTGGFKLPLGWYFSDNSFQFVQKQADYILNKKRPLSDSLSKHFKPLALWKD